VGGTCGLTNLDSRSLMVRDFYRTKAARHKARTKQLPRPLRSLFTSRWMSASAPALATRALHPLRWQRTDGQSERFQLTASDKTPIKSSAFKLFFEASFQSSDLFV